MKSIALTALVTFLMLFLYVFAINFDVDHAHKSKGESK